MYHSSTNSPSKPISSLPLYRIATPIIHQRCSPHWIGFFLGLTNIIVLITTRRRREIGSKPRKLPILTPPAKAKVITNSLPTYVLLFGLWPSLSLFFDRIPFLGGEFLLIEYRTGPLKCQRRAKKHQQIAIFRKFWPKLAVKRCHTFYKYGLFFVCGFQLRDDAIHWRNLHML